jgi:hypothetical protein
MEFHEVHFLPVSRKELLPLIESQWIIHLQPKYNINQLGIPPRPKNKEEDPPM